MRRRIHSMKKVKAVEDDSEDEPGLLSKARKPRKRSKTKKSKTKRSKKSTDMSEGKDEGRKKRRKTRRLKFKPQLACMDESDEEPAFVPTRHDSFKSKRKEADWVSDLKLKTARSQEEMEKSDDEIAASIKGEKIFSKKSPKKLFLPKSLTGQAPPPARKVYRRTAKRTNQKTRIVKEKPVAQQPSTPPTRIVDIKALPSPAAVFAAKSTPKIEESREGESEISSSNSRMKMNGSRKKDSFNRRDEYGRMSSSSSRRSSKKRRRRSRSRSREHRRRSRRESRDYRDGESSRRDRSEKRDKRERERSRTDEKLNGERKKRTISMDETEPLHMKSESISNAKTIDASEREKGLDDAASMNRTIPLGLPKPSEVLKSERPPGLGEPSPTSISKGGRPIIFGQTSPGERIPPPPPSLHQRTSQKPRNVTEKPVFAQLQPTPPQFIQPQPQPQPSPTAQRYANHLPHNARGPQWIPLQDGMKGYPRALQPEFLKAGPAGPGTPGLRHRQVGFGPATPLLQNYGQLKLHSPTNFQSRVGPAGPGPAGPGPAGPERRPKQLYRSPQVQVGNSNRQPQFAANQGWENVVDHQQGQRYEALPASNGYRRSKWTEPRVPIERGHSSSNDSRSEPYSRRRGGMRSDREEGEIRSGRFDKNRRRRDRDEKSTRTQRRSYNGGRMDEKQLRRKRIAEEVEPTIEEAPCPIVFRDSSLRGRRGWQSCYEDDQRRSYASILRNPFEKQQLREWYHVIEREAPWNQPEVNGQKLPRKAAWFVSPGCRCTYRYSNTAWKPTVFPEWFIRIQDAVFDKLGINLPEQPNSCNVNLYFGGRASVGWHSDNEPIFQSKFRDCLIVSLSLGCTRKFQIKRQDDTEMQTVYLEDGDLMTMEGLFQKHYLHRVPKETGVRGSRINLTWRWITKHSSQDMCNGRIPKCVGQYFGFGSKFCKKRQGSNYRQGGTSIGGSSGRVNSSYGNISSSLGPRNHADKNGTPPGSMSSSTKRGSSLFLGKRKRDSDKTFRINNRWKPS